MSMALRVALLAVAASLLLTGCTLLPLPGLNGSGDLVTEEYDLEGFTAVHAGNAFKVTVTQGDDYSVVVTYDNNAGDALVVETQDNALVLKLRENVGPVRNLTLRAEVTMPALEEIIFSGATTGSFTGFRTEGDFHAELAGASSADGEIYAARAVVEASGASNITGTIEADDVRFEAAGASRITFAGAAQTVEALASGASRVDLSELTAVDVRAEADGASTMRVAASGVLEADAAGSSTIEYSGNPATVRENVSGASNVRAVD